MRTGGRKAGGIAGMEAGAGAEAGKAGKAGVPLTGAGATIAQKSRCQCNVSWSAFLRLNAYMEEILLTPLSSASGTHLR
jgi:hypothetical protein